jgi:integron integrase
MKSLNDVIEMVRTRVRSIRYSYSTEQCYCHWIARYYSHCLRLPWSLESEKKVEHFLSYLATHSRVSARTQNQAFSALLFLYKEVLHRPLAKVDALRAKNYRHERTAPSREQVQALRQAVLDTPTTPARLLVDLLYGCGLRVSEPLEMRIQDILWEENHLVIRAAKGAKDRRVPLPRCCHQPLRAQVTMAREIWEGDRKNHPEVGVTLPNALGRKYPTAAFSWQWFWVFPAANHCRNPYSGKQVRYHVLHDALQRAVREAATRVGLQDFITPHVLRHAFATHSREPIETLRELMGHISIETTSGYRHPVVDKASNPLDDLVART